MQQKDFYVRRPQQNMINNLKMKNYIAKTIL